MNDNHKKNILHTFTIIIFFNCHSFFVCDNDVWLFFPQFNSFSMFLFPIQDILIKNFTLFNVFYPNTMQEFVCFSFSIDFFLYFICLSYNGWMWWLKSMLKYCRYAILLCFKHHQYDDFILVIYSTIWFIVPQINTIVNSFLFLFFAGFLVLHLIQTKNIVVSFVVMIIVKSTSSSLTIV